jgi:hypothetical protein
MSSPAAITGAAVLIGAILALSIVLLRYRMSGRRDQTPELSDECLELFSHFCIDRYEPMMRLGSEEDFEFLARQPGYRPEIGARLRSARRRIFRMYLRDLASNFSRIHAAARRLVADLPEHHADLVALLIRCQLTFWRRILMIEIRLLLPDPKLPKLDLPALIEPLESIRLRVSSPIA